MKTIRFNLIPALALCATGLFASNDWLNIYYRQDGRVRVSANALTEIDSVYFTAPDSILPDSFTHINIQSKINGLETVPLSEADSLILGTNIPTLYIDTDPYVEEITSKTDYLKASLRYIPYGDGTDTLVSEVNIRGRGNTTWLYPKKPYRLKFDKKQSIGGLRKAKSFVLLANFLDNTMLKDAIAYKMADLLGMPFANGAKPVNLVFNRRYRGTYILTEKTGINAGSVDIDETTGILWELDTYFDEDYRFVSDTYGIPCMAKDPDFMEIADGDSLAADSIWRHWKEDLNHTISNATGENWEDFFDAEQMVKFVLVNNLMANHEISFPKSVKLYKEHIDGKYKMGPVWDFDWTLGYNLTVSTPYLVNLETGSYDFFRPIFQSKTFQQAFREEFIRFRDELLPALFDYIDSMAKEVRTAAYQDAAIWKREHWGETYENVEINKSRFDENIEFIKNYIQERISLIEASPNFLLY